MNELEKYQKYGELINKTFNQPPCDVTDKIIEIMEKYPHKLYTIDNDSFILLIKLGNGVYGISWVVTDKKHRNQRYASRLLDKIHLYHKGMFITKTDNATVFYEKNGYKTIAVHGDKHIMVFFSSYQFIKW